jgi:hypothetical protein
MNLNLLRRRKRLPGRNVRCAVCEDFGSVPSGWVYNAPGINCTCGAAPGELPELTFHDVQCDTLPCPFCQLLETLDA